MGHGITKEYLLRLARERDGVMLSRLYREADIKPDTVSEHRRWDEQLISGKVHDKLAKNFGLL